MAPQVLTGDQLSRLLVTCVLQQVTNGHKLVVNAAVADRCVVATKHFVGKLRTPELDLELQKTLKDVRPWVCYSN